MRGVESATLGQKQAVGQRPQIRLTSAFQRHGVGVGAEPLQGKTVAPCAQIRVEHRVDNGAVGLRQCRAEPAQAGFATDADGQCMGQGRQHVFQVDPLQRQRRERLCGKVCVDQRLDVAETLGERCRRIGPYHGGVLVAGQDRPRAPASVGFQAQ
ncbi:hypothetical protein D3C76_1334570 [compost metagenome]